MCEYLIIDHDVFSLSRYSDMFEILCPFIYTDTCTWQAQKSKQPINYWTLKEKLSSDLFHNALDTFSELVNVLAVAKSLALY